MLSAALARLEKHPMPAAIDGVAAEMFDALAPEMHGMRRVVLSNMWLFTFTLLPERTTVSAAVVRVNALELLLR